MRLRGYHVRGSSAIEDVNLEFRDSSSNPLNIVLLLGKNGSGKTYILGSIARTWSNSVLTSGTQEIPYIADMMRIDYEMGNEICSVHVRRGRLEKSSTLAKYADVNVGDNPHVKNGIVYYSSDRGTMSRSTVRNGTQLNESVSLVFPILYDLHMRDIRDSVILIDDWDKGLDEDGRKGFYSHMVRHILSKGNQLVLSSSNFSVEFISDENVLTLSGRTDATQKSIALLNKVDTFTE